jgi:hypothetical protein
MKVEPVLPEHLRPTQLAAVSIDMVAVFAVLGAMLAANTEWAFTRDNWVDTWMYFGFFRHYDVPYYLADNKKIARLPWILLGFFVNHVVSPAVAAVVLHVGLFALGAYGLYKVARHSFGREAAVVATLTYVTWVPMLGPGGWDYHNTLLPALYFASQRSLVTAASNPRRPLTKFARFGALYALAVHTNILAALLAPALLIEGAHRVHAWVSDLRTMRWLGKAAVGSVLGGIGITVVLGAVNVAFGRSFFFFDVLLSRSEYLLAHPGLEAGWWFPWSDPWWLGDPRKILDETIHTPMFETVLILILACAVLRLRRWSFRELLASSAACAMLEYLASLGMFALGQTLGHPLLQPFYMAIPVALPMFVALAALISEAVGKVGVNREAALSMKRYGTAVALLATVAFGVQFVWHLALPRSLFAWRPELWYNLPPILVILVGFLVATLIAHAPLVRGSRWPQARAAIALGCLAVTLGQANVLWPIGAKSWAPYMLDSTCAARKALLSAVVGADDILFPLVEAGREVVPWYHDTEEVGRTPTCRLPTSRLGEPLFALGYGPALHYWEVERVSQMPDAVIDRLIPGRDVVALVSNDEDYVARLLDRLRQRDPAWREAQPMLVGGYGIDFGLHLISAEPDRAARRELGFRAEAQNGAKIRALPSGGIHMSSPATRWTYIASLVPKQPLPSGAGTMVVGLRVVSGMVAIGVLNRDGSDFLAREVMHATGAPTEIYLTLPDWRQAGTIMVETTGQPGRTEANILSLAFARGKSPQEP